MIMCEYGCGNTAIVIFKNGKHCCKRRPNMCPAQIEKMISTQHMPDPVTGLTPLQQRQLTLNSTIDTNTGKSLMQQRIEKMTQSQTTKGVDGITPRQKAEQKLSQINPLTGLSKKQEAGKKAAETKKTRIDPSTGLTVMQSIVEKNRQAWETKDPEKRKMIAQKKNNSLNQIMENGLTKRQIQGQKISRLKRTIDPVSGLTTAERVALLNSQNPKWHSSITRGRSSKESLKIFDRIAQQVSHLPITCIYGHENGCEWWLKTQDNKIKYYDFTIPELKIIIEYNGEKYHPNTSKLSQQELLEWKTPYTNTTAQEVIRNDEIKRRTALAYGYTIKYIWSSDDIESTITQVAHQIITQYEKQVEFRASPI